MTAPSARAQIEINAAPARVYDIITDLAAFAEITEETQAMAWKKGTSAAPGSVFRGKNKNGWRSWSTNCKVTEADGSRFAFEVTSHPSIPVSRWQYEVVPTGSGCTVIESTWDMRPRWFKRPAEFATGVKNRPEVNTAHMQATLARLKAAAEADAS